MKTEEEIMIDDECQYNGECPYAINCLINKNSSCFIKEILDDYYNIEKKYFRLKQENECLKEKLIIAQNSDNKTMEILKENAELKQENEELRNLWRLDCLKCVCLKCENTKSNVDNYRTALEEIREMLITCCDRDYCEGCEYYDKCFNGTSVPDIDLVMINKINEVLNG